MNTDGTPTFDFDFEVRRGGFARALDLRSSARTLALVGASGSGKTSLLHAIAGLLRPTRGRIAVGGRTLFDAAARIDVPTHRRRVGYVFQDARLLPHLDVRANLLYGARHAARVADADAPPARAFDDVVALLGLGALLQRRTTALSGGETQRVALGRALLARPRVLLLDEPLSMLDLDRRDELLPYLVRVRDDTRLPMIYVSHQPDEVRRIAEAVHVLPPAVPDASRGSGA